MILNEPEKNQIIQLTTGYQEIIAPQPVIWEVGNAFSAMLKRKRLDIDSVINAIEAFNQIPIRFVPVDLTKSLKISDSQNIYAYDAYVIQCAIRYKRPLITLDKQLIRIAKSYQIEVLEVNE